MNLHQQVDEQLQNSPSGSQPDAPAWFDAHLDQLLAVWEWRSGPTPLPEVKAKAGCNR